MKRRTNMQVSVEFDKIMKEVQRELMMKEGRFVSSREITEKIKKEDIQKIMFERRNDITINFDRRRR